MAVYLKTAIIVIINYNRHFVDADLLGMHVVILVDLHLVVGIFNY